MLVAAEKKKIITQTPARPPGGKTPTPIKAVPRLSMEEYMLVVETPDQNEIYIVSNISLLLVFFCHFTTVFDFFFDFFQVVGHLDETRSFWDLLQLFPVEDGAQVQLRSQRVAAKGFPKEPQSPFL